MTKPRRYKRFSSEFKREAIMRASEEGMTDKAVCDELGVSTRQFWRWRDELALLGDRVCPLPGLCQEGVYSPCCMRDEGGPFEVAL